MRTGPLSNERFQQKAKRSERMAELQQRTDLGRVMATPEGRRVLWHFIMSRCLTMSSVPVGAEGLRMEGKRDVGIELTQELQEHHAQAYLLMVQERFAAQAEDNLKRRALLEEAADEDGDNNG